MPRRRRCGGNEEGRMMNDETETFRILRGEVGLFPNGVAPSSRRNLLRPPRNQASSARDLLGSGRNRSDPNKVKPELRSGQPKVAATPRRRRVVATPSSHFSDRPVPRRCNWRRGRRQHLAATGRRSYPLASFGVRANECLAENACFLESGGHASSQCLVNGFQVAFSLTLPAPTGRGNRGRPRNRRKASGWSPRLARCPGVRSRKRPR